MDKKSIGNGLMEALRKKGCPATYVEEIINAFLKDEGLLSEEESVLIYHGAIVLTKKEEWVTWTWID